MCRPITDVQIPELEIQKLFLKYAEAVKRFQDLALAIQQFINFAFRSIRVFVFFGQNAAKLVFITEDLLKKLKLRTQNFDCTKTLFKNQYDSNAYFYNRVVVSELLKLRKELVETSTIYSNQLTMMFQNAFNELSENKFKVETNKEPIELI